MIMQTNKDMQMVLNYRINNIIEVMQIHKKLGLFNDGNWQKLYPRRATKAACRKIVFSATREELLADPSKTACLFKSLIGWWSGCSTSGKAVLEWVDNNNTYGVGQISNFYSWWLSPKRSQSDVIRLLRVQFNGKTWEECVKW